MRFSINMVTRTYLDYRLINRWCLVIVLVLVGAGLWNVSRAAFDIGELRRLRSEVATIENRLAAKPHGVSEKDYTKQLAEIGFYNEIISRKTFNWMSLLDQLESTAPDGIALSLVQPDRKTGTMKIDGRAKNFAQVTTYLEKLMDSKVFSSVLLLSHTDIAAGDRTQGIQFSISCKAALQ